MRLFVGSIYIAAVAIAAAQVGGGAAVGNFQGGQPDKNAQEAAKRVLGKDDLPPSANSTFIDASVLMNVVADEYVAVFAISREGATPAECLRKVDATVAQFKSEVTKLGVGAKDSYVDYIVANKVYDFVVGDGTAVEKLAGFELKKNISVHYRDRDLLDRLVEGAANADVFDLVKVDYVVKDIEAVQDRLMDEAAKVIKRKASNHGRLLGMKLIGPSQVYAERYLAYYPTEHYSRYTAAEAEDVSVPYQRDIVVKRMRKNKSYYFDPVGNEMFDRVVNPVIIEPVVQFTLYLKVRYENPAAPSLGKPEKARAPK